MLKPMTRSIVFGLLLSFSSVVHAETWQAESILIPDPSTKCPDTVRTFEFSAANGTMTVKTPANATFTAPISPDGAVSLSFTAASGAGTVIIAGNALNKNLQMTAPRSLPGCRYAMRPVAASATPESTIEWRVSVQQVSGNVQKCSSGNRGRVRQTGLNLYLYDAGRASGAPTFATRVNSDGSFDGDVRTTFGANSTARLKVAPGQGPRPMEYVTYANVCGYRVVPD
ncbi:hypothetical protein [Reyranella soli]|uniref:Reelin domain-containing protein n=1 Tax=Reyranella soli TaxID=1230389 RepID=A0A512NR13_9HYPH|nr:hypothetical protein [Reyranella soli]GEP61352.1 hypothetical protein RSO01_85180 [Reyranella soli]